MAGRRAAADAGVLLAAGKLVTRTRNVLTRVRGKQVDQLPTSGRELTAVARALGRAADNDPGQVVDEYRRITRRARAIVERSFGA